MMLEDINTILLYIFVILLLFCIMYILFYSDQNISFDDNLDGIESSINKYKKNNKENFDSLNIGKNIYNIVKNSLTVGNNVYNIENPLESARTTSSSLSITNEIQNPLGPIPSNISSLYNDTSSMLDTPQGWTAATKNTGSEYIILDLGSSTNNIAGIITQGRGAGLPGATIKLQSVTEYKVEYSENNNTWTKVDNDAKFVGNTTDIYTQSTQDTKIGNIFATPISARYIKIKPTAYNNSISMRVGILKLLPPYYSENDGKVYLQSLTDFNKYIENNQSNLTNILITIQNAKEETSTNNSVLMNSITKLYYKQYLEYINKINAAVYNESNKMMNPKTHTFTPLKI